jgi:UDP-3-O-[3-hydroxymyristoyl] glucosamine N-acyltransferase
MATSITLEALAALTDSELFGDPSHTITYVSDLASAGPHDAAFFVVPKYGASRYEKAMEVSQAGVVFIEDTDVVIEGRNYLISKDASRSFQKTIEHFVPRDANPSGFTGIHPTAVIHDTASLGADVTVGPYAVIDQHVTIGDKTFIAPHAYIGASATIGTSCYIHPHVTIREHSTVGNNVIIQPGAVIGSCGFGYTNDERGRFTKLQQVGAVSLGDDVEIGANTTIDRARFTATQVGRGTKIDNLVQLGHGVTVGEDSCIISQTGIAGSTSIGNHVILAGQTAVTGHVHVGDGVIAAGCSGITKSIMKPGKYGGLPAIPLSNYNKQQVHVRKIASYVQKIKTLEQRVKDLEETLAK